MAKAGKALEHDYDTGEVRVTIAGKVHTLAPPTIGQMRQLDLMAETIDRDSAEFVEEKVAKALAEDEDLDDATLATLKRLTPAEMAEASYPWWAKFFELCGDPKQPIPPSDDCPLWIGSTAIIGRLQAFWVLYPFVALGPLAGAPGQSSADESG